MKLTNSLLINNRIKVTAIMVISALFIAVIATAQINNSTPVLKVTKTADFTITGDGSNYNWSNTGWQTITERSTTLLQQNKWNIPADKAPSTLHYSTQFKILYSDKGIYCLYQCEDSTITATLTEDYANLYDEDVVEAFFWPDTTMPLYFEYELSPLNYELPVLILNNNGNIMGWKPWQYSDGRKIIHAIHINKNANAGGRFSWTAELFIPFALLSAMNNVPPQKGTQWRANFYRIDYDKNAAYSSWQLTQSSYHDYKNFGTIEFN